MAKGLFIVVGLMAAAGVAVGSSMSNEPHPAAGRERPVDAPAPRVDAPAGDNSPNYERIAEDGTVELERSDDGHFYADVEINGATVRALVDTGASGIALSRNDARMAGIATSIGMPNVVGRGADGYVFGEEVILDTVALGHERAHSMPAIVLNAGHQTLLGQSFLARFEAVEIRGDRMVLR